MRVPRWIIPAGIKQKIARRRERKMADIVEVVWERYWAADRRRREQTEAATTSRPTVDEPHDLEERR